MYHYQQNTSAVNLNYVLSEMIGKSLTFRLISTTSLFYLQEEIIVVKLAIINLRWRGCPERTQTKSGYISEYHEYYPTKKLKIILRFLLFQIF